MMMVSLTLENLLRLESACQAEDDDDDDESEDDDDDESDDNNDDYDEDELGFRELSTLGTSLPSWGR